MKKDSNLKSSLSAKRISVWAVVRSAAVTFVSMFHVIILAAITTIPLFASSTIITLLFFVTGSTDWMLAPSVVIVRWLIPYIWSIVWCFVLAIVAFYAFARIAGRSKKLKRSFLAAGRAWRGYLLPGPLILWGLFFGANLVSSFPYSNFFVMNVGLFYMSLMIAIAVIENIGFQSSFVRLRTLLVGNQLRVVTLALIFAGVSTLFRMGLPLLERPLLGLTSWEYLWSTQVVLVVYSVFACIPYIFASVFAAVTVNELVQNQSRYDYENALEQFD